MRAGGVVFIFLVMVFYPGTAFSTAGAEDCHILCVGCGAQNTPTAISVGSQPDRCDLIFCWLDGRGYAQKIYLQKVWEGAAQYGKNGIIIIDPEDNHNAVDPQYFLDKDEMRLFFVWQKSGYSEIYFNAFHLGAGATINPGESIVAAVRRTQRRPRLASATAGYFVVWEDYRDGKCDIYAQRIGKDYSLKWGDKGKPVCTCEGDHYAPELVVNNLGTSIVVWYDGREGDNDVYAQVLDVNGERLQPEEGIPVCTESGQQVAPRVVPDGANGAFVVWLDSRDGFYTLYAQRISPEGSILWDPEGVRLNRIGCNCQDFDIAGDNQGNLYVVWIDDRWGGWSVYAQRVDRDGNILWTGGGLRICKTIGEVRNPGLALNRVDDGKTGVLVVWEKRMLDWDIYGQLLDELGGTEWRRDGTALVSGAGDQCNPSVDFGGDGEIYISYEDYSRTDADILYSVIEPDGRATDVSDRDEAGGITLRCFPNPFNSTVAIRYFAGGRGDVCVEIFDCSGRRVWKYIGNEQENRTLYWNGTDERGRKLPSGIYFCRLRQGTMEKVTKIALVR